MRDPLSLTVDACLAAIADAGLTPDDIDGLSHLPGRHGLRDRHQRRRHHRGRGGAAAAADVDQRRPEIPGPGGSILDAMLAVANGLCRHVLCFRTVWESTSAAAAVWAVPAVGVGGDMQWRMPFGAVERGQLDRHERHAVPAPLRRDARAARSGRGQRPRRTRRSTRTRSTATRSRWTTTSSARLITTPFGLYDCDVPCDGAMAVIVSDGRRRRRPAAPGDPHRGRRARRSPNASRGTRTRSPTSRR